MHFKKKNIFIPFTYSIYYSTCYTHTYNTTQHVPTDIHKS